MSGYHSIDCILYYFVDSHLKEFVDLQKLGVNVVEDLAESWFIILV